MFGMSCHKNTHKKSRDLIKKRTLKEIRETNPNKQTSPMRHLVDLEVHNWEGGGGGAGGGKEEEIMR